MVETIADLMKWEDTKKEIALEIIELLKSKDLSVALIDNVLDYTKQHVHKVAKL